MFRFSLSCVVVLVVVAGFDCATSLAQSGKAANRIAIPTPVQYLWHEQERIMFVCIDPATWQGREYDDHSTPLSDMALPRLDTDQWCEAAAAWGAKEILFVAKHTGGFCWWRTDTTDYCVRNIAWRDGEGDLLEELARSCGRYGLNIGIYIYPGDASWGAGIGSGGRTSDPAKQEAYDEVFRTQLREAIDLAAKYTRVTEVWFDGSCVIEVGDILREHAPEAVVFQGPHATIRWVGNERGRLDAAHAWSTLSEMVRAKGLGTAQHSDPDGDSWAPLEVNTTLYDHHWFWSAEKEADCKSLDELMRVYYESAGQGAVMLLNSTPNTDGLIPQADMALYRALGQEIERRFGKPIARTQGRGREIELSLEKPTLINHVIVMEDYLHGERIRGYVVEGRVGGRWVELASGAHVGRKRIVSFKDVVVEGVRLRVTEAARPPVIRGLEMFHVSAYRPAPDQPVRSAWRQCAAWTRAGIGESEAEMTFDLTPYITQAGQWRVTFRSVDPDAALRIGRPRLLQGGQASAPGAVEAVADEPNTFNINRTAVITEKSDIRLIVTFEQNDRAGVVLIRPVE